MTTDQPNRGPSSVLRKHATPEAGSSSTSQRSPRSLHLHIVSESNAEALARIAQAVRAQYADVHTTDHEHFMVQSSEQLSRVLEAVQASPGIVIYDLSNQGLVKALEQFCTRLNMPCLAAQRPRISGKTNEPASSTKSNLILPASNTSSPGGTASRLIASTANVRAPAAVILALLALFLVWQLVTRSMAAYLADAQPKAALQLQPSNSKALLNLAGNTLDRGVSDSSEVDTQTAAQIRSWSEEAIRNDPLNSRPFGILAKLSADGGDEERLDALMQGAARRSLRESSAVYWTMVKSLENGNFDAALYYADALLRTRGKLALPQVVPILLKIVEAGGTDRLATMLADNPPWRAGFFQALPAALSTDARLPMHIFLALKDTANPVDLKDLNAYLEFLMERGFYDVAYYTWLQFLPAEQLNTIGRIFNGDFEFPPSGTPFDWQFPKGSGAIVEVANPRDRDGRALFIRFVGGRVDFDGVSQTVMLPPGKYEFQGKKKVDLVSREGLRWQVSCAKPADNVIGQSYTIIGSDQRWKEFSFSFTVPESDCPAQEIRLVSKALAASDKFMSGYIWFDDLRIVDGASGTLESGSL